MTGERCERFGKWFGCKFEGRFEDVPGANSFKVNRAEMSADHLRAALYRRAYIRDICVRCGKTVERTAP